MNYEQIRYQFDEIEEIVRKIVEENPELGLTYEKGRDRFISTFSKILENRELFSKFLDMSGLPAREVFITILMITGCNVKDLSKAMSKEVKTALKNKEIV